MRSTTFIIFGVVFTALACSPTPPATTTDPSPTSADPTPTSAKSDEYFYPKKDDVIEYLVGKSITLATPVDGRATGPSVTLTRENMEAVEVQHRADSGASAPWSSTPVDLVVGVSKDRFIVQLRVLHRLIDGKRFFKEFEVIEVVKQ